MPANRRSLRMMLRLFHFDMKRTAKISHKEHQEIGQERL